MSDNIKVAIRVRPLLEREKGERNWAVDGTCHMVKPTDPTRSLSSFYFDQVFGEEAQTEDIFRDLAQPLVEAAMNGFNGTIFAYGQTASGKTHTMLGTQTHPGIIPMATDAIFSHIDQTHDREFLLRLSYMEIYNENVKDLFSDPTDLKNSKKLPIREDSKSGNVFVEGIKEEFLTKQGEMLELLKKGEVRRHYGITNMNDQSSRSHTILQIIIESTSKETDGVVNVSRLNLVDLAGSENAEQTGASGQRLTEGGFINKSLSTLGQVISQLSDNAGFINYRDSKLTRILQSALGGNSKTAIIGNISPAAYEQTVSTLRFATRAKRIKNKPVVNQDLSDEALMKKYKREADKLQRQLDELKNTDTALVKEENEDLKLTLQQLEQQHTEMNEKMTKMKELIIVSSITGTDFSTFKKKRRETWCPGKARMSMAPNLTSAAPGSGNARADVFAHLPRTPRKFSLGAVNEQCEEEEDDDEVELETKKKRGVNFAMDVIEIPELPATPQEPGTGDMEIEHLHAQLQARDEEIEQLTCLLTEQSEREILSEKVEMLQKSNEKLTNKLSLQANIINELELANEAKELMETKVMQLEDRCELLENELARSECEFKELESFTRHEKDMICSSPKFTPSKSSSPKKKKVPTATLR